MKRRIALPFLLAGLALTACDDDTTTSTDTLEDSTTSETDVTTREDATTETDATVETDATTETDATVETDATTEDAEEDTGPETLDASQYCELTVDFFCDYYVRCGRIAATTVEDCEADFLETCNADFEPRYVALEAAGLINLDAAGMAACETHLGVVACEQQIFDLDGGCAGMWRGGQTEGGICAPGIENFICEPGTACVLGLDFCGTCQPTAATGEPCGADQGITCGAGSRCVDGACVVRALPGEACSDAVPCATGSSCVDSTCVTFDVVAVGEACDGSAARCPYGSVCANSVCVLEPRLGESCDPLPCATGWCDAGTCVEKLASGTSCTASGSCQSGLCVDGNCAAVPGPPCFP